MRLLAALARGTYETAARVASVRDPAMPLPSRHEALADLARFVGDPGARTEIEAARLRAELRRDRELSAFIAAVVPGLADAFTRAAAEAEAAGGLRANA